MPQDFDTDKAHLHFSTACFNSTWDLLDNSNRSEEDNEEMVRLAHVSLWHWTKRSHCTAKEISIGNWLLARVYAVIGQPDNSRSYARLSLHHAPADQAFFVGYAYEALARAEHVAGNHDAKEEYLHKAQEHAERVADNEEKKMLLMDLESLS